MNNNWDENNNMNSGVNEENINSSVQPQPTVPSVNGNNGNTTNNNLLKNKKVLIIIGAVVAVIVLFFLLTSGGVKKVSTNNGYTETYGNTLKVKEITTDFELKVLGDFGSYTNEDDLLNSGDYITLKVSIKNNSNDTLSFSVTSFDLVDENKEKIVSNNDYNSFDNSITNKEIASGKTEEGILYFSEKDGPEARSKAKYLKVSVLSDAKETGPDSYSYEKEDYYLELK